MASSSKIEEVSSMLRRESSFFKGIQSAIYALKNLNDFLVCADPKSVENLMSEFVGSLLDHAESEQFAGVLEQDCLANLSKILQEPRIADFLGRAGQQISESRSDHDPKLFYSFVDEYANSLTRDVVALLSPGGIGETYVNPRIRFERAAQNHIDRCYWVDSLGWCKIRSRFEIRGGGDQEEVHKLGHSNQRNRYMFVFDQACHQDFWLAVKRALSIIDKLGKIESLISGDRAISSFDQFLMLGPLPKRNSWELFCRIAFQDEPERRCPTELEALSREIVGKCKGFPFPIVGLAGLLSKREKKVFEWKKVCNSFKLEVKTNLVQAPPSLNVHGFPDHLRQCYQYFSMFAANSVIPKDKLLSLWIAEGFVEEKMGKALEEVAEEYLNELIDRGLVQPCQGFGRLEQYCTTDKFKPGAGLQETDALRFLSQPKCRRVSIYADEDVRREYFDSELHSLFLFGCAWQNFSMTGLIKRSELLKVVNFERNSMERLPDRVGDLIHLKYLSLKGKKLVGLPMSLQNLINLQTLDLRDTLIVELPSSINELNLRHILTSFFDDGVSGDPIRGVKINIGIESLQNLQTLTMVGADRSGIEVIKELAALRQLRMLGVSGLTAQTASALCGSVDQLSLLKSLTLQAIHGNEVLSLQIMSSPLLLLQRLILKGRFQNLPPWIFEHQNLSTLSLNLTLLSEGQMILLSHLPNLISLWLCRAYKGNQLYFKEGSFEKLKLLVLRELRGLSLLQIEDGALPCLEELRIGSSPRLRKVPYGVQYLKNLKLFINYDMPREFVVKMQPDGGFDYWKVEHIASVFFLFRVEGRKYKIFELGDSELLDHYLGFATNEHHITEPLNEHEFSFCEGTDDEEEDDYVGSSSFSRDQSNFMPTNFNQMSFSSSLFTDDLEE